MTDIVTITPEALNVFDLIRNMENEKFYRSLEATLFNADPG